MNSYYIPLPFQKSSDAVSMSDCDAAVVGKAYFPARMAGKLTPRLVQEACKAEKLQTAPKMATIKNCTFLLWKTIITEQESYHFKRVQFITGGCSVSLKYSFIFHNYCKTPLINLCNPF